MALTKKEQDLLNTLQARLANGGSKGSKVYDPATYVKKSGCGHKMAAVKSGRNAGVMKPITWGWKANKGLGITSYTATVTDKYSKEVKSTSGKVWITGIAVTAVNQTLGTKGFAFGMMEKATGKVIVKEWGIVLNPKGGKGGVVGRIGAGK